MTSVVAQLEVWKEKSEKGTITGQSISFQMHI